MAIIHGIHSHLQLEWLGGLFIVRNDVERRINIDLFQRARIRFNLISPLNNYDN